jgi:hypothetical protein
MRDAPGVNSGASNRKSTAPTGLKRQRWRLNPLEGEWLFVTSQTTYHLTAEDHLQAENSAPYATIPFVLKLPCQYPCVDIFPA